MSTTVLSPQSTSAPQDELLNPNSTTSNDHHVDYVAKSTEPEIINQDGALPPVKPLTTIKSLPNLSISILPLSTPYLPSFRRLIALLLPIRYPDAFFNDPLTNPNLAPLTRLAIYTPPSPASSYPAANKRKRPSHQASESSQRPSPTIENQSRSRGFETTASTEKSKTQQSLASTVVGAIRCRLEPTLTIPLVSLPLSKATQLSQRSRTKQEEPHYNIYIQALGVLAPYRGQGLATTLLESTIASVVEYVRSGRCGSQCEHKEGGMSWKDGEGKIHIQSEQNKGDQEEYGGVIENIYAHVWEANEDALEWYVKRGFVLEGGVIEGYYRKLKPHGARIVRRPVKMTA
ncbi:hypothetical protein MMC25_002407 [Agyrium rufum]|nr:hypothetical protein [Agyrium rufum]